MRPIRSEKWRSIGGGTLDGAGQEMRRKPVCRRSDLDDDEGWFNSVATIARDTFNHRWRRLCLTLEKTEPPPKLLVKGTQAVGPEAGRRQTAAGWRKQTFNQPPLNEAENGAPVMVVLDAADVPLATIEINNDATFGSDMRGGVMGGKRPVSLMAPVHRRLNRQMTALEHVRKDWRPQFRNAFLLRKMDWTRLVQAGPPLETAAIVWEGFCAIGVSAAAVRTRRNGRRVVINPARMPSFRHGQRSSQ